MTTQTEGVKAGHTKGPWSVFIDDTGGPTSGWPLSINADTDPGKMVVRTGGQWPYEWDAATSQREAVANAYLIAAAPTLLDAAVLAAKELETWQARTASQEQALTVLRAAIAKALGQ